MINKCEDGRVSANGYANATSGAHGAMAASGVATGDGADGMLVSPDGMVAGCASGCAAVGCASVANSSMSFVGAGRGDYTVVTTYKYVGPGEGELTMGSRVACFYGRFCGTLLLVAALIGLIVAVMSALGTTTTTPGMQQASGMVPQHGECTFWGDPHFVTFDGARPSFYGEGEFYVVKSRQVSIQGRFMGTNYTKGLAATNKIAVGGPFLQNHVVEVGCMEDGPITVDGAPVLQTFPSTYDLKGIASITYSTDGKLVDKATSDFQRHIVHMELPMGIRLTILRWGNYLDFRLAMAPQGGMDGACGNFNGDPTDDATEAVFQRLGARVPDSELLFKGRAPFKLSEVEEKLLDLCSSTTMARAREECPKQLAGVRDAPQDQNALKSCYLDVCFGSNEHVLKMATQMGW